MKIYCKEGYDFKFEETKGLSELALSICKLDKESIEKLAHPFYNHVRELIGEARIMSMGIGVTESGDKILRIYVYDYPPTGENFTVTIEEDGNRYIEVADITEG